jgi:hypothetical protein
VSERFDWHPEPELIDVRDPERARNALETLGQRAWTEALDWLYQRAMERPTAPDLYPELRAAYYGPTGAPGPPKLVVSCNAVLSVRMAPARPIVARVIAPVKAPRSWGTDTGSRLTVADCR